MMSRSFTASDGKVQRSVSTNATAAKAAYASGTRRRFQSIFMSAPASGLELVRGDEQRGVHHGGVVAARGHADPAHPHHPGAALQALEERRQLRELDAGQVHLHRLLPEPI